MKGRQCLFCKIARSKRDDRNLLIRRGRHCYSLLNLYPYANGHSLVVPYRHVGEVENLTEQEWLDLWRLASDLTIRMNRVLKAQGFNIGINVGRAAGAGVPKHLHLHIVPRWVGDSNFMTTVGDTRVISRSLRAARALLVNDQPKRA